MRGTLDWSAMREEYVAEQKQSPPVVRREMKGDGSVSVTHRGGDPPQVATPQSLNRNSPPPRRRLRQTVERWTLPASAAVSRSLYADDASSDVTLSMRIMHTIHEMSAQDTVQPMMTPTASLMTGEVQDESKNESKDENKEQGKDGRAPVNSANKMTEERSKQPEHDRDDGTECPICKGNLRAPLVAPCGHAFCQACVQRIENGRCPECNEPAHLTVYYPCYALAKAAAGDRREASWVNNYRLDWLRAPQRYSAAEMRTVADAKKRRIVVALVRLLLDEIGRSSQLGHKRLRIVPPQQRAMSSYFHGVKRVLTAEPFRYRCLRVADGGSLILWSSAAGDSESDDDEQLMVAPFAGQE